MRGNKALRRKAPVREPYDVVLIVCEGSKTEPNYFQELRNDLALSNANITVTGNCPSDPVSIVKHAKRLAKEDGGYDRVYCVFDKDSHVNYGQALELVDRGRHLFAITSVPCFEFWLLLHFENTARPYNPPSPCTKVITDLHRYLPGYRKNSKNIYNETKGDLETAIRHAEIVLRNSEAADTDNPSTKIHELIKYLQELKEKIQN